MTDFGSRDDNNGSRSSSNNNHNDNAGAADNSESASARRGACASSYCNGGCFAASPADIPPALITTHAAAFDDLARQLPQLTGALTMTGNGVALLSESGQYSTPSFTDGPLLWDHNRVNLRLHAPAVRSVA
ncbi:MAG: hypothetical protein JWQ43_3021, partial [Glaciihabitans sp.]|nr:hypothetical protein [Glaciihabitans sp.]